ncbi:MAG TPA: putative RNA uridine N3 methyltransferase [Methanobacteriaceae archaeon]|nr:putative RNA uridine N3 methyltransferase [Methanobacteriaceae archaeon]
MEQKQISIFIPLSFVSETKDLKVRTYKVGLISRSAALFRVNRIVIYDDVKDQKGAKFISDVLSYMNTPQYLRKQVFPITRELRNVGILPPLRTPHHPTGDLHQGDYRQGLTIKRTKKGTIVDIGADRLALCKEKLSVNRVLNFKVEKLAKEILITPDEPDTYWGYETLTTHRNLQDSLKAMKPKPDLVIGTSRFGQPITSVLDEVKEGLRGSKHVAILFGGPYSGLHDLQGNSGDLSDLELNTVPHQGTQTVRTEEAVLATLSIFNLLLDD